MRKYTEKPSTLLNIGEAARRAKIPSQRFRRAVKLLRVPIYRSGWTVLIEEKMVSKVRAALEAGLIRRGRPAKKKA